MPDVTILDARPPEEWLGLTSKTALLGHIPSSLSHQWCDLLLVVSAQDDEGATPGATWCNNPTILSDEWLRLADVAQVTDLIGEHHSAENRIITYCNRGKQSAVIYAALRQAGLNVSAYNGSRIEWSRTPSLPVSLPSG